MRVFSEALQRRDSGNILAHEEHHPSVTLVQATQSVKFPPISNTSKIVQTKEPSNYSSATSNSLTTNSTTELNSANSNTNAFSNATNANANNVNLNQIYTMLQAERQDRQALAQLVQQQQRQITTLQQWLEESAQLTQRDLAALAQQQIQYQQSFMVNVQAMLDQREREIKHSLLNESQSQIQQEHNLNVAQIEELRQRLLQHVDHQLRDTSQFLDQQTQKQRNEIQALHRELQDSLNLVTSRISHLEQRFDRELQQLETSTKSGLDSIRNEVNGRLQSLEKTMAIQFETMPLQWQRDVEASVSKLTSPDSSWFTVLADRIHRLSAGWREEHENSLQTTMASLETIQLTLTALRQETAKRAELLREECDQKLDKLERSSQESIQALRRDVYKMQQPLIIG